MQSTAMTVAQAQDVACIGILAGPDHQAGALQPHITRVGISSNPDQGEVFKVGSIKTKAGQWEDRLALAKSSLELLGQALGIVWDVQQSKPLELSRNYVLYRAVGFYRQPDGTYQTLVGTKEIDLEVLEEDFRMSQVKKLVQDKILAGWGKSWGQLDRQQKNELTAQAKEAPYASLDAIEQATVDHKVNAEMVQMRLNKVARAETGARNRAIRSLGVKSTYSPAELQEPFTLVKWQFAPDSEQVTKMSAQLWGPAAPQQLEAPAGQLLDSGVEDTLPEGVQAGEVQEGPLQPPVEPDPQEGEQVQPEAVKEYHKVLDEVLEVLDEDKVKQHPDFPLWQKQSRTAQTILQLKGLWETINSAVPDELSDEYLEDVQDMAMDPALELEARIMELGQSEFLTPRQAARIPGAVKEALAQEDVLAFLSGLLAKVESTIQASKESEDL
jgi:hypothetical protein